MVLGSADRAKWAGKDAERTQADSPSSHWYITSNNGASTKKHEATSNNDRGWNQAETEHVQRQPGFSQEKQQQKHAKAVG